MKHPLLNPKSKHYQKAGCKPAIQELEERLNIYECIGYAKGNINKYSYRIDQKGQEKTDAEKIETYEKYQLLLETVLARVTHYMKWEPKDILNFLLKTPMCDIYSLFGIEIDYEL